MQSKSISALIQKKNRKIKKRNDRKGLFDPSRISLREEKQVYKGIPYLVFQHFVMQ